MGRFSASYQSRRDGLIRMEIASYNYHHKQDCYQCNISLLVMQLDNGVNEAVAATVR